VIEQYLTSAAILRVHAYRPLGRPADPFDLTLHSVHTRVGLLIFVLAALRLLLRAACGAPEWREPLPPWRRRLSAGVQYGLYAVLLGQAATGAFAIYIIYVADERSAQSAVLGAGRSLGAASDGATLAFVTQLRETLFRITGLRLSPRLKS
jgi:cytochrome b561